MYLILPSHEITAETGNTLPYTGNLYYNLIKYRDQAVNKPCNFFVRIYTELGFIALCIVSVIESVVHLIFGAFSTIFSSEKELERRANILSNALLTTIYSAYSLFLNLFVQNLTSYLFSFDLFMRPYAHQSVFFEACRTGNFEMAKKLYQMGLDPHQKNSSGMSPALYAHICGHANIEKLFPCNTHEQEYLELKLLSHWLNISGDVVLNKQKISLEGAASNWMFYSIGQALKHFRHDTKLKGCSLSQEQVENLEKAFIKAYYPQTSKEIVDLIRSNQLCVLGAGWKEHSVTLVFFKSSSSLSGKDYLAVCNRGQGADVLSTMEVFRIDTKFVTQRVIEEIKTFFSWDNEKGMAYLYHALPGILSPTGDPAQDETCLSFKKIAPNFAKTGNCSLTGKKAALRFAWIVSLNEEPNAATLQKGAKESKIFTDWTARYYFENIKLYDKFHGMNERNTFIPLCNQAAAKKKKRYEANLLSLKA